MRRLVDRTKLRAAADMPGGMPEGDFPERIYGCLSNEARCTALEWLWLLPEMRGMFGRHRRAGIGWLAVNLLLPGASPIWEARRDFMDWSVAELLEALAAIAMMACGLGPAWAAIVANARTRRARKEYAKESKLWKRAGN